MRKINKIQNMGPAKLGPRPKPKVKIVKKFKKSSVDNASTSLGGRSINYRNKRRTF